MSDLLSEALQAPLSSQIATALPMPVLLVGPEQEILFVNPAAEQFFGMGAGLLLKQNLAEFIPFGSPLLQLMEQARERNASVGERDLDLTTPRLGEKLTDVNVTPVTEPEGAVVIVSRSAASPSA